MSRRLRQASAAGHHGIRLIGTAALIILLLCGAAAWRLSRGPVDLPPLAARIGAAATRALPGFTVTIGRTTLAWEGFHHGGAPLDFRLSDISIDGRAGIVAATISRLRVTLAPFSLLHGSIAPIRIIATHPAIVISPEPAASAPPIPLRTEIVRLGRLLRGLSQPQQPGRLALTDFHSLRISHATLEINGTTPETDLQARNGTIHLARNAAGHISGSGSATLLHHDHRVTLTLHIAHKSHPDRITATLGPFVAAQFAPAHSLLAGADLPLTLDLGWSGTTRKLAAHLTAGAGHLRIGGSVIPIRAAAATVIADSRQISLSRGSLALGTPAAHGQSARFTAHAALHGPLAGQFTLSFDSMSARNFDHDWPQYLLPNVRNYVLKNVRAGTAHNGYFKGAFDFAAPADTLHLTAFTGHFTATGVTLSWFHHAAPMTQLAGKLVFLDKDTLAVDATTGRLGALALHGTMLITTLTHQNQNARINIAIAGPVADAFTILNQAPLHLATQGVTFPGATGQLSLGIDATLPLINRLKLHDVHIAAAANLARLHLPLPLHGLTLDNGALALSASLHHLSLHGDGTLAGAPVAFAASMPFPDGQLDLTAHTAAGHTLLHQLGANPAWWRRGAAPLTMRYQVHDGRGTIALHADLTPVALALPQADWSKHTGIPAHATVELALRHGQPASVNTLDIAAPGLTLRGHRQGNRLIIDRAQLNHSSATGRLTPPPNQGAPWHLTLAGPLLDLAALLHGATRPATKPATPATPNTSPSSVPWRLTAAFRTMRLAKSPHPFLGPTEIIATGHGSTIATVAATASLNPTHHARLSFTNQIGTNQIRLTASDAGALLAATGTTHDIVGGALTVTATHRGTSTTGRAILTDFRLRHAPVMAKILQGLSIYGVPAATSGPGLALSRLTAPFTITGSMVHLGNGRVTSPSLGFTGTGTIDLASRTYDLSGTIVPAYALNALPGRIPIIGKLFSPEKGSGLFAARYTVAGPFANPHIVVDPLAALAPGLLREIFGVGRPVQP